MTSDLMLPGPKMIFIPGGTYQMGERGDFMTVGDFLMDETPVTVAQYREAVRAGACTPPEGTDKNDESNWGAEGREDHPVNCVSWYQAEAYAEWAGKRLPTEEEWGWAARGGDEGRLYPWGSEEPSDHLCWNGPGNDLGEFNRKSTSPVGSYPKGDSKHGLKDMSGNVYEWTSSYHYTSNYEFRVAMTGGCYTTVNHFYVRVNGPMIGTPWEKYDFAGFRCVRSV